VIDFDQLSEADTGGGRPCLLRQVRGEAGRRLEDEADLLIKTGALIAVFDGSSQSGVTRSWRTGSCLDAELLARLSTKITGRRT
jgi:hypothetical protein